MEMQPERDVVVREVRIAARPETIFPFLIEPEKMVQWKGMAAELEPRPGGKYWCNITGVNIASGRFLVVEPPRRVVFTFGWEGEGSILPPGSTTVEIVLIPDGDGTVVHLRHSGLPAAAEGQHAEGWEHYLARLTVAGAGGDPGPDLWIVAAVASS